MTVRVVTASDDGERHRATRGGRGGCDAFDDLGSWLRDLVWSLGPVAPAVGIVACGAVRVTVEPGQIAVVSVPVVNRQAATVSVLFEPSTLRSDDGGEWLPAVVRRSGVTVPAAERRVVELAIEVPEELPVGTYRGSLVGLALEGDDPGLVVDVVR